MKVILDTNIWISFLIGHQTQLIRKILSDVRLDVCVCDSLIAEIKDVAGRDKIRKYINSSDVEDLMAIIYAFCQFTVIQQESESDIRDPKDLYLLSLAETIGADFIVSGDNDLTDLKQHMGTKMIKLADFKSMMNY